MMVSLGSFLFLEQKCKLGFKINQQSQKKKKKKKYINKINQQSEIAKVDC